LIGPDGTELAAGCQFALILKIPRAFQSSHPRLPELSEPPIFIFPSHAFHKDELFGGMPEQNSASESPRYMSQFPTQRCARKMVTFPNVIREIISESPHRWE
jgi:hypothetical protein